MSNLHTDEEVIGKLFSTTCYPEQGVPLLFYPLYKNEFDFQKSILANINIGGDNVLRGIIPGLLAGATNDQIHQALKQGLSEYDKSKMK